MGKSVLAEVRCLVVGCDLVCLIESKDAIRGVQLRRVDLTDCTGGACEAHATRDESILSGVEADGDVVHAER